MAKKRSILDEVRGQTATLRTPITKDYGSPGRLMSTGEMANPDVVGETMPVVNPSKIEGPVDYGSRKRVEAPLDIQVDAGIDSTGREVEEVLEKPSLPMQKAEASDIKAAQDSGILKEDIQEKEEGFKLPGSLHYIAPSIAAALLGESPQVVSAVAGRGLADYQANVKREQEEMDRVLAGKKGKRSLEDQMFFAKYQQQLGIERDKLKSDYWAAGMRTFKDPVSGETVIGDIRDTDKGTRQMTSFYKDQAFNKQELDVINKGEENFRKETVGLRDSLEGISLLEKALQSGNPVAFNMARTQIARIFEKGVLTDKDFDRYKGSPALKPAIDSLIQKYKTGEPGEADKKYLSEIMYMVHDSLSRKMGSKVETFTGSMKSKLKNTDEGKIRNVLMHYVPSYSPKRQEFVSKRDSLGFDKIPSKKEIRSGKANTMPGEFIEMNGKKYKVTGDKVEEVK